ncbi:type II toxin-antitoxin system HicA family toxin [Caproicibacterium sp. NSD3]
MSKKEKLIKRILTFPTDFTYDELRALLISLEFEEDTKGKTSGSAVSFKHKSSGVMIYIHKPHPTSILKLYQVKAVVNKLKENGDINE